MSEYTWTNRPNPFDGDSTESCNGICWSPDLSLFVAVGNDAASTITVCTSSDGITWVAESCPFDGGTAFGVAWSPALSLFVAVGEDAGNTITVCTSPDGSAWTAQACDLDGGYGLCVAWSESEVLFAVGGTNAGDTVSLCTSPDGTAWTAQTGDFDTEKVNGVLWVEELSLWLAGSDSDGVGESIYSSADAVTWTPRSSPFDAYPTKSFCWSPTLSLLAATGGASGTYLIATSSDGIAWAPRTSNTGGLGSFTSGNGSLVAVGAPTSGSSVVTSSTYGTIWSDNTSPMDDPAAYAASGVYSEELGLLVVVGQGPSVGGNLCTIMTAEWAAPASSSGPQPPSSNTATWSLSIADWVSHDTEAFITPFPDYVRYTRRRSGYCEMSLGIVDKSDLNILEGSAYSKVLRAFRNGINRFNGQFVEIRETADAWEFVAKDAYFNMSWREVRTGKTYLGTDAGQIAWSLINFQNGYSPTYLGKGSIAATVDRDRKYSPGDRVSEKIEYLTKLPDGFYFTINAIDGSSDWSRFQVHATSELQPQASFEFGSGTSENCQDYQREVLPLVNRANVQGSSSIISAESTTSPDLHGLWEASRGQVLEASAITLAQIAAGTVADEPQYQITLIAGPEAPQLFTDFDVGDTVPFVIKRLGRTFVGTGIVDNATVLLDPNSGTEQLESLELVEVVYD